MKLLGGDGNKCQRVFECVAAHVIARAEGLAIISVVKAGFMITARGGSGIVIARLADRRTTMFVVSTLVFIQYKKR